MARTRLPAVETKVIAPVHLRAGIPRSRLIQRLESRRPRILSVVAPAGYGKTRLLAEWVQRLQASGSRVAWLSLDERDANPQRFLAHLLRAFERGEPLLAGVLPAGSQRFAGEDEIPVLSTGILNALAQISRPLTLVLDDAHHIDEAAVWPIVNSLLRDGPALLHFVVAARRRLPLPAARARAMGDLLEIEAAELAFSEQETAAFLAAQGVAELTAHDVAALHDKTEGWAAALQLAAIALRDGREPHAVIGRISGRDQGLSEYLFEDVFRNLPADLKEFLLHTAILDRLHPEICDAVTGRRDSRDILGRLERLHLFLVPLEPERNWFRYHTLFSEFLLRQLRLSEPAVNIAAAHRRASAWLLTHGHISEAVNQLFAAGDHNGVVELLLKHCDDIYYAGQYADVLQWLERLPMSLLHRHPRLMLNRVWALVHDWRFDEAGSLIKTVRRLTASRKERGRRAGDSRERRALEALTAHRQAMMLLIADRLPQARDAWRKLLAGGGFADPYLQGSAHAAFALSQYGLYSWDAARTHLVRAERLFRSSRQTCGKIWSDSFTAICRIGVGDVSDVEQSLREAMASAVRHASPGSPFVALPALPLADFLYERNRVDEARTLIGIHLDKATTLGTVDQLIAGYVTAMRLSANEPGLRDSEAIFRRALACADRHDFPRLRAHALEERLRQLLAAGEWTTAQLLAGAENLMVPAAEMKPRRMQNSGDEARALAWSRIAFAGGDFDGARAVLTGWIDFARRRGYRRTAIRFGAVQAAQLHRSKRTDDAIDALWEALRLAATTGATRPFVDEGGAVVELLRILPARRALSPLEAALAGKVAQAFRINGGGEHPDPLDRPVDARPRRPNPRGPVEALKRREREILRRIARGMTNREIADDLSLSVGTINWYLHQMYQKLGVHRRSHAVIRGKAFGYLDRPEMTK